MTQRPGRVCARLLALLVLLVGVATARAMTALDDQDLSGVTGQALLMSAKNTVGAYTFYRMGLDADVELNTNIGNLQLGCGGVNGAGNCDIDISNLSISGNCPSNRPDCSALLTRPFIELAFTGDASKSTRQVAGVRLSAELLQGLMTAGVNDGTANGINSLSGYMNIAASSGTAQTATGSFTNTLTGRVNIGGCIAGCPRPFTTNNGPLSIPSMPVTFNVAPFTIQGNRMQSVNLAATANIPDIPITSASGVRSATLSGCFVVLILPLCNYGIQTLYVNANIQGLRTNININEDLGYIHKIPLNNPFSLSFQKENLTWPGAPAPAQRGWWLALSDPVNLGSLSVSSSYQVDISPVFGDVATYVSNYLYNNPIFIPFGAAVGSLFTGTVNANVGNINLSSAAPLPLNLSNLPLGTAQDVVPNCWGAHKFC